MRPPHAFECGGGGGGGGGITQELFHLICSFKNLHKENAIMHNLSDHSLQLIIIFQIKTSVLLGWVLGKSGTFNSMRLQGTSLCACCFCAGISMGLQGTPLCACCFCAGILMSCLEAPL